MRDDPPPIDSFGRAATRVALVGAGPGDPELLTLRAYKTLRAAEAVVYDQLVGTEVLALAPTTAELYYAGKRAGCHAMPQAQINALLVRLAERGLRVVRLKGGDPYIFGRGGEEAEHLAQHGFACEVVPGITSASAAASYGGIPLTHRDYAQSCLFVTGHLKDGGGLDWPALARAHQTLVVYMGLGALTSICAELIRYGRAASTPAALIERASTPRQRVVTGTLAELPALAAREGVQAPALIIIGEVVRLRERLRVPQSALYQISVA